MHVNPLKIKALFLIIWSLKDIPSTDSRSSRQYSYQMPLCGSIRGWGRSAGADQVSGSVELSERIMGEPSWSSC